MKKTVYEENPGNCAGSVVNPGIFAIKI